MRSKLLVLLGFCLLSCSSFADISVEKAYVRGLPPGQVTTAVFMRLINDGDEPVVIAAASTESAERAEFHAHTHSNGMMSMKKVDSIVVPAQGIFELKPGSHHLMLVNLKEFLRDGEKIALSLFYRSDDETRELKLTLPVRSVLKEHKY